MLPGCEADQEAAQDEREANAAWYEDPSYAERVADREWSKLLDEYEEWLGKEAMNKGVGDGNGFGRG